MTIMTGGAAGTMANWTPEVWSKRASLIQRSNTILANMQDRRWEPELRAGQGDTVKIPVMSQNTGAVARSSFGTAADLSSELIATTEGQVALVVDKMAIYGFAMPEEGKLQAMPQYEANLMDGIPQALILYLDYAIASDTTNGLDAISTIVGTDGVDLTSDDVLTAQLNLDNVNASAKDRFLVLSPASYGSLIVDEIFRNQLYGGSVGNLSANKPVGLKGGPVYGFEVWTTNNLADGSAGHKNAAFQREYAALCVQENIKIDREYSVHKGFLDYRVGRIVFGQKKVKDTCGVEMDGK